MKPKWARPKLIVLIRSDKSGARVLDSCKTQAGMNNVMNMTAAGCKGGAVEGQDCNDTMSS